MTLKYVLILTLLLLLAGFSLPIAAAASEISVELPDSSFPVGVVTTVPVIITDADNLETFTITVQNTIPGVDVSINESKTNELRSGNYINNFYRPNERKILWFSTTGLSGDNVTLFFLDIQPLQVLSNGTCLTLSLEEIGMSGEVPPSPGLIQIAINGPADAGLKNVSILSGWNFISVPKTLKNSTDTAAEFFSTVDTVNHAIITYNSQTQRWMQICADDVITPLTGYWVYSRDAMKINLHYPDNPGAPAVKTVYPGWNTLGLSAEVPTSAKTALAGLNWRAVLPWDLTGGVWGTPIVQGGTAINSPEQKLSLGSGYWLYAEAEGTLIGLTA